MRSLLLGMAQSRERGFSLLELVVVVCLIAILFAAALNRYYSYAYKARVNLLSFQASTFSRTIENVRALATLYNTDQIDMGNGLVIVMNRSGWPYSTFSKDLTVEHNASSLGCRKLWQNIFSQTDDSDNSYQIDASLINGRFCRYALGNETRDSYFFDYDLVTGNVTQNVPE